MDWNTLCTARFIDARQIRGLSWNALEAAGLSRSTGSAIASGKRWIRLDHMAFLAMALDTRLEMLLDPSIPFDQLPIVRYGGGEGRRAALDVIKTWDACRNRPRLPAVIAPTPWLAYVRCHLDNTIRRACRSERERRGLAYTKPAAAAGMGRFTLSRWESGSLDRMEIREAVLLLSFYDLNPRALLEPYQNQVIEEDDEREDGDDGAGAAAG